MAHSLGGLIPLFCNPVAYTGGTKLWEFPYDFIRKKKKKSIAII